MNWTQWSAHAVIVGSAALMLCVGMAFKLLHKRTSRRSPLQGRKVGNLPGQQLVARVQHHDEELSRGLALMFMSFPLMFLVWATFRIDWQQVRWGTTEWITLVAASLMFGWGVFDYVRHFRRREQASDGLLAERVTGLQLNRLLTQGCIVLHDLPADGFNIDHVVIAPRGVYAVETKSLRKPRNASEKRDDPSHQVAYDGRVLKFPDFGTREPIEQATRQAQWLRRVLRDALGHDYPVVAAVSLPGWFIVPSEEGKRADVQVFTPMGRGADFMARQPEHIDATQRRVVAETLAARYPSIDA